jgi:legumain
LTAADATESSWASYCPPNDYINGTEVGSCLGDLFSTNWMEDTESHLSNKERIGVQHLRVKMQTSESHVSNFGDLSLQLEPVGAF